MRFIIGLLVGAALTAIAGYTVMKSSAADMMFVEYKSPYGYEETIEKVKQGFLDNDWKVISESNFSNKLLKKLTDAGETGRLTGIKVCRPQHALNILKDDNNKQFATMMPCGVAVFEKNGNVYVSTLNIGMMKAMFHDDVNEIMGHVAHETQTAINGALAK